MSIHSNLSLLLENIDNPEIFNLHLENPKDIILNILKTNDLQKLVNLHNECTNIIRTQLYNIETRDYIDDNLNEYNFIVDNIILMSDDILLYLLRNIKHQSTIERCNYLYEVLVEYKDNFNELQKQYIRWFFIKDCEIEFYNKTGIYRKTYNDIKITEEMKECYYNKFNDKLNKINDEYDINSCKLFIKPTNKEVKDSYLKCKLELCKFLYIFEFWENTIYIEEGDEEYDNDDE